MLKRSNNIASAEPVYPPPEFLAPVNVDDYRINREGWAGRLMLVLRVIAGISLVKGLYHWSVICGFVGPEGGFAARSLGWQVATVLFAVIDLVAAVGLWLAAPWGTLIWLASAVTMIVVYVLLPQIYGLQPLIILFELILIGGYGYTAWKAARERPAA